MNSAGIGDPMHAALAYRLWFRWLLAVTLGVVAGSIGMLLAPDLTRRAFGMLNYFSSNYIDSFGQQPVEYIDLLDGVLGSVMLGWSTALLIIVLGPFRRCECDGWRVLAWSVGAWFVPDTLISLTYGFWQNAILNSVIAGLYAIPLAATYRAVRKTIK